jgi:hypothetical protein
VRLIAVTAWGGAGNTSLVSEWLRLRAGRLRDGVRGVHVWSFYQSASGTDWAESVLAWIDDAFPEAATSGDLAHRLTHAARTIPLVLVLDGLETMQAPPDSPAYGQVTGTPETGGDVVRRVINDLCRQDHETLLVATSRFPLTDVQVLEGSSVRSIPLLRLTEQEGAELIERGGGRALSEDLRKKIVRALDGHALAVRTAARIAGTMAAGKHTIDNLLRDLLRATRDDERVEHVLITYAEQLPRADRMLVGVVSLFGRPVTAEQILAVGRSTAENGELSGWSAADVEQAARTRLRGTLTWHDNGTLSAHPLIRQTFRPYALSAAPQFEAIRRRELPSSVLTSRLDAESVLEIADVLVAADLLVAAHDLHETLAAGGAAWWWLPAVSVGDQTSWLFVASPEQRRLTADALGTDACVRYLVLAAALALGAGSIDVARRRIALAQASGAGTAHLRPAVELILARIALTTGDLAEAELHAREAVAAAAAARDAWGERLATAVLAKTLFTRAQGDDVVQARATMAQALNVRVTGNPDGVYPGPVTVELWDAEMLGQLGDGERFETALIAARSAAASRLPKRDALGVSVASISSWESPTSPSLPPEDRLHSLALFFATPRSLEGNSHLLDVVDLTPEEEGRRRELIDELVELREAALAPTMPERSPLEGPGGFWFFPDDLPVRIIVPGIPWQRDQRFRFTDPWDPDYTSAFEFAAADAVVELVGHVRAENPGSDVRWLVLPEVEADDIIGGHVVLLEFPDRSGLAAPIDYLTRRLDLPLHITMPQDGDRFGQAFVVTVDDDGRPDSQGTLRETYRPRFVHDSIGPSGAPILEYDVALLARAPNPLNLAATVTFCAGIFAAGTYGAVRSLTDANLRGRNERFLDQSGVDITQFWVLMQVPMFTSPTRTWTLTPDLLRPFHRLRVSS